MLIERDPVPVEKGAVLCLKGLRVVVFGLAGDICT